MGFTVIWYVFTLPPSSLSPRFLRNFFGTRSNISKAKMFRTMLQIQQGSFAQASQAARDMVEISNRPEIRHMYVHSLFLLAFIHFFTSPPVYITFINLFYRVKNELFLPVIMPNLATMGSLSKVVVELYHFTQQLEKNNSNIPTSDSTPNYILKQETLKTQNILPSYSLIPPNYSPTILPISTPIEITDLTPQQVPQTDKHTPPSPPPQFLINKPPKPKPPIALNQPDMQNPTTQPTLQLTLQRLFLQQGLNSRSPFASSLPASLASSSSP
jgi:hypothetical protein